jgi:pyruvate/2-oxoglutarate dehydrogenase complex dihydrolipoamide acyltransferase (E2) component
MSSKLVRQAKRLLISGAIFSIGVGTLPAQAQSSSQVARLVEALRKAAPQTGRADDGLYSEWKIKADNIPRWSKLCTGQAMTVQQFEANPTKAREIIACVMQDTMRDEFKATGNNETAAVRRSACWWMTGDPTQCKSGATATYADKVLGFYQQGGSTPSAAPAPKPAAPAPKPPATETKPTPQPSVSPPAAQTKPTPQPSVSPPATETKPTPQPTTSPQSQVPKPSSQSKVSDNQVGLLVEALRQAAPQTDTTNGGLYSEWQVKPENIASWSQKCLGKELTPTQFQDSPVTARSILTCVMRDVMSEQYTASNNNEFTAVERAASWWMTGDPTQYNSSATGPYAQKVLDFYKQSRLKLFSHI